MFVADFQLGLGADHPLGEDAPDAGGFEFLPASGVRIEQAGAGAGEADFLAGGHIGGAADHLGGRGAVAGIHLAQGEGVGVGMGAGGVHIAHHAAVPAAADGYFAHLNAGHRQAVGQFGGGQNDVNVVGEPGKGDEHKQAGKRGRGVCRMG